MQKNKTVLVIGMNGLGLISQKLLSILGFEPGDNLSEMAENLLKKKGMTLDEYLKGEKLSNKKGR